MTGKPLIPFVANIDSDLFAKWQEIADLLAEIISVPAALIMLNEIECMEVLVSSKTDNNPYHPGDKEKWLGLYCQTVIKTQKELLIPNVMSDPRWNINCDIKVGMVAYLGFPINFPDKHPFGALCVLDSKENSFSPLHRKLMLQLRDMIEMDITMLGLVGEMKWQDEAYRQIEEELRVSKTVVRDKLKTITEPEGDIGKLELSDIIDTTVLQSMMENFYKLTGMLGAILDISGKVLVAVGWQDICTKFHRCNPDTLKKCHESDTILTTGVPAGIFKAYRCKNNMWDIVTPIIVGGRHVGNVFIGQFLYKDEIPDVELFRTQARKYGFDESEYLSAFERVPRFTKEEVNNGMQFYAKLAGIISTLSYSAIEKSRLLAERKKAELSLSAEKERLAVTLRSIGDGVITTDIDGNIVLMNKVAEDLTGWKQEKARGESLTTVFKIINKSTRQPYENPVKKVLSTSKMFELANHTILVSRDGTERMIADSAAPILDNNANTIGVVLVFRDTTEKDKLLEITLNSQKLESLGILAGGIAHDFNNLMGGVFGYIDLAIGLSRDPELSSYLAKALGTIDRVRALTQQLLTFDKGGAPIKKIEPLFPFVQETAKFALSGSTVFSSFQIQENLWPCDIDKNQIGQVIDNLVINAQQAMPGGGEIEFSAKNITFAEKQTNALEPGNYVKISIADHGIGIPKEYLSHIFDPFFTTKPSGHGLGLATTYSIVNRHGGCIEAESEPGKGSTFHMYLPASPVSVSDAEKKSTRKFKSSGTFLVMDDEKVMRETIGGMLESIGYSVILKENGEDAVAWFDEETKAKRTVAGMIFDLTIPGGMGGREAIGEIRKICLKTPVFVVSGYADDPVMSNPKDYGFSASICKPFWKAELVAMINENIGTKSR